jgi:hypothetical protein
MKNLLPSSFAGSIINQKLETFARLLEAEQIRALKDRGVACEANVLNAETSIKPGSKYVKVDVGTSGKFMVEIVSGNIFGIKGYGTPHKGHFYGTLDTIAEYDWSQYYPARKDGSMGLQPGRGACPALTHAPVLGGAQ